MRISMKMYLFALVLAAAGMPAVAEDGNEHEGSVTVSTPEGARDLGGDSDHQNSHEGLHRAADRSQKIEHHHENEEPSSS